MKGEVGGVGMVEALDTKVAYKTLPEMYQYVLDHYRNSYAFGFRREGSWQFLSTETFAELVRRLALGLWKLGIQKGDCVGILAPSGPQWLVMDLAIMSIGAVSVPLFAHISEENFEFQVTNSRMKALLIMGQDQWQTYSRTHEKIAHVVTWDVVDPGKGSVTYQHVLALGDEVSQGDPCLYTKLLELVHADDLATIIYTSGSTGVPKGVEISHRNLISQIEASHIRFRIDQAKDRAVSCLPLAHVFQRMVTYWYVSAGISIYFVNDLSRLAQLFREIEPTITAMVPRILEKMYSKIMEGVQRSSGVKKSLASAAMNLAAGEENGLLYRLLSPVLDPLVYRKIRQLMGGKLDLVILGGAPLGAELSRFFTQMGIPIYQGYGLTETSPVLAVNFKGSNRHGSVGPVFPGVELRIGKDGEIQVRGPNVMKGYHRDPQRTQEVIDDDGWLHTGDLGKIDEDGFLWVTGRLKEILKTSGGKMVTPVPIEQALCSHSLIDAAMVVAEGKKFVSCLLFPDFDVLMKLKADRGKTHATHEEFLESDYIKCKTKQLIDRVNRGLNSWESIRKFRWISHPISVEGGELTPTLKIRRKQVLMKYATLIDGMYQEGQKEEALVCKEAEK